MVGTPIEDGRSLELPRRETSIELEEIGIGTSTLLMVLIVDMTTLDIGRDMEDCKRE